MTFVQVLQHFNTFESEQFIDRQNKQMQQYETGNLFITIFTYFKLKFALYIIFAKLLFIVINLKVFKSHFCLQTVIIISNVITHVDGTTKLLKKTNNIKHHH